MRSSARSPRRDVHGQGAVVGTAGRALAHWVPLPPEPDPRRGLRLRRARRADPASDARRRHGGGRADGPDALPGRVRVGCPARLRAEHDTRLILIGVMLIVLMNAPAAGAARRDPRGDRVVAPLLDLRGVSKSFGGLACITELDLHVDAHEIVSVIGPNGAGKTTLFNLITGVYEPDRGAIDFDGREPARSRPAQDRGTGDRAHLPDAAAVPEHDGEGERDGGRLLAHPRRDLPLDAAHAGDAARGEGDRRGWPRSGSRSSASG